MDVAPSCYIKVDRMGYELDGSPGGVKYRAPYGAIETFLQQKCSIFKFHWSLQLQRTASNQHG